jgi:hypothetical protein
MEFNPEELKKWWDKISPEDQYRIMNRNNSFDFLFKEKTNNTIKYESTQKHEPSVNTTTHTLVKSD